MGRGALFVGGWLLVLALAVFFGGVTLAVLLPAGVVTAALLALAGRPIWRYAALRSTVLSAGAWLAIVSGGVGVMAAASSFILIGQIESSTHPTRTLAFLVALVLLCLGVVTILIGLFGAGSQWVMARWSPLIVEHDPDDEQCAQHALGPANEIELRLRVRNAGRVGLNHVRAQLQKDGGHRHWLRLEHDNTPPYERSLTGDVLPADPDFEVYIDVARLCIGDEKCLILEYADSDLRGLTRSDENVSEVAVQVVAAREIDGVSVRPVKKRYRIELFNDRTDARLVELP
jgi:hypothetical protein